MITGALVALLGMGTPAMAADNLQLIINKQLYTQTEQQSGPLLKDERVYVPLRLVGESLGYQVGWSDQQRSVHIVTDPAVQEIVPEGGAEVPPDAQVRIYIDGAELQTDEYRGIPYISETGQSMVPLRLMGQALNCDVQWQDGVVIVETIVREPEVFKPEKDTDKNEETNKENTDQIEFEKADDKITNGTTIGSNQNSSDKNETGKNETSNNEANNNAAGKNESSDYDSSEFSFYDNLTIQGKNLATAEQLHVFLDENEEPIRKMMEKKYPELGFTPFPEDIVELYLKIGEQYNIRGDVAFAQAVKETGYFQFYGKVKASQNNFCGLCAGSSNTGNEKLNGVDPDRALFEEGLYGVSFASVADGVEAHIQHLYAYATTDDIPRGCELVDPRFDGVKRGTLRVWPDLNGKWAVPGNGYGESIIDQYWIPMVEDTLPTIERHLKNESNN